MKFHLAVAFASVGTIASLVTGFVFWTTGEREHRIASINQEYAGQCVSMPAYASAKVVSYFETSERFRRQQFQMSIVKKSGDEEVMFVPAEAVLPLAPQPCDA